MPAKTTTVTVRMDPKVKSKALKVLDKLGITTSQAVSMYFTQISEEQGLPFRPHIPNAETLQAMHDLQDRRNIKTFDTPEDLFKDLNLPNA